MGRTDIFLIRQLIGTAITATWCAYTNFSKNTLLVILVGYLGGYNYVQLSFDAQKMDTTAIDTDYKSCFYLYAVILITLYPMFHWEEYQQAVSQVFEDQKELELAAKLVANETDAISTETITDSSVEEQVSDQSSRPTSIDDTVVDLD